MEANTNWLCIGGWNRAVMGDGTEATPRMQSYSILGFKRVGDTSARLGLAQFSSQANWMHRTTWERNCRLSKSGCPSLSVEIAEDTFSPRKIEGFPSAFLWTLQNYARAIAPTHGPAYEQKQQVSARNPSHKTLIELEYKADGKLLELSLRPRHYKEIPFRCAHKQETTIIADDTTQKDEYLAHRISAKDIFGLIGMLERGFVDSYVFGQAIELQWDKIAPRKLGDFELLHADRARSLEGFIEAIGGVYEDNQDFHPGKAEPEH